MTYLKFPLFLLLICYQPFILFAQTKSPNSLPNESKFTVEINFDQNQFVIEKIDSFDNIQYHNKNNTSYFLPIGYPKLPYISNYVLLPHASEIVNIVIRDSRMIALEGFYHIVSTNVGDIDTITVFNDDSRNLSLNNINSSEVLFPSPSHTIKFDSVQLYAGFLLCKIYICPYKYFVNKKQLFFCKEMKLHITYRTNTKQLKFEPSPEKIGLSRKFIRNMVLNTQDVDKMVPLEEKIDYSKIQMFKELQGEEIKKESLKLQNFQPSETLKPFYIEQIKIQ